MRLARRFIVLLVVSASATSLLFCQQVFEVNLNDRSGDTFKVTLYPEPLSASNSVFQFASTAPGTYEVMDIGRFVDNFKAFDKAGNEVPTEHSSTNQWTISHPAEVKKITYTVADLWNAKVKEHRVYPMCSTTLSDDFVMINGQGVFGYFNGLQSEQIKIKLSYPSEWKIGTALRQDGEGYYVADDFDKVVDSPFYLGNLTTASTEVGGAKIDVFTYSKRGLITSEKMLASLKSILKAESDFTRGLPVDRYVFLFHFGTIGAGAWEHSYSSEYVMNEDTLSPAFVGNVVSIVAHEFFHVNVPLNIHSELIEHFNFVKPVMSQHLWLYEGTTEWAAHTLQLRDGLISLKQYLQVLQSKLNANDSFDPTLSLASLGVHSTEMEDQYPNIYQKGALVSTLLDIRLLQLSHGKMGLRELLMKLSKEYGKKRAFSEANFFDQLVAMTYPEIGDFINRYIKGAERLPVREYFASLGIDYKETGEADSSKGSLRLGMRPVDSLIVVSMVYEDSKCGLIKGDVVEKIGGTPLTFENAQMLFSKMVAQRAGSSIPITIKRGGKEMEVQSILEPRVSRHLFTVTPEPSPEQIKMRDVWMSNM
jgi:predicted metalloprotease with PDZ domain